MEMYSFLSKGILDIRNAEVFSSDIILETAFTLSYLSISNITNLRNGSFRLDDHFAYLSAWREKEERGRGMRVNT